MRWRCSRLNTRAPTPLRSGRPACRLPASLPSPWGRRQGQWRMRTLDPQRQLKAGAGLLMNRGSLAPWHIGTGPPAPRPDFAGTAEMCPSWVWRKSGRPENPLLSELCSPFGPSSATPLTLFWSFARVSLQDSTRAIDATKRPGSNSVEERQWKSHAGTIIKGERSSGGLELLPLSLSTPPRTQVCFHLARACIIIFGEPPLGKSTMESPPPQYEPAVSPLADVTVTEVTATAAKTVADADQVKPASPAAAKSPTSSARVPPLGYKFVKVRMPDGTIKTAKKKLAPGEAPPASPASEPKKEETPAADGAQTKLVLARMPEGSIKKVKRTIKPEDAAKAAEGAKTPKSPKSPKSPTSPLSPTEKESMESDMKAKMDEAGTALPSTDRAVG